MLRACLTGAPHQAVFLSFLTFPVHTSQGDGVWLPHTDFQGAAWVTTLHREWFAEYSAWSFTFLEVAATAGAVKGFTEVIGFFHWKANNTGAYACVGQARLGAFWRERGMF